MLADSPSFSASPESAVAAPVVWRFAFRGTAAEFFRIWMVNNLLTIATLGLFSPWAKVRTRRYFYGSAFLNGANFDYHASPWSILVARILLVVVISGSGALVAYYFHGAFVAEPSDLANAAHFTLIALLLPWAVTRGIAFNARYSSHRGAHFRFEKNTAAAYGVFAPFILFFILFAYSAYFEAKDLGGASVGFFHAQLAAIFICIMAASPWLMRSWHNFKASNHALGPVQFYFQNPPLASYFAALWGIPFYAVAVWGIPFLAVILLASFALSGGDMDVFSVLAAVFSVAGVLLLVVNFIRAKLFHTFWNHVRFSVRGESGKFNADFSLSEFAVKILTVNFIVAVLSLGLLHPWAKVRRARFIAQRLTLETTPAALDKIPGLRGADENAFGEEFEAAEGFDFDVGLV